MTWEQLYSQATWNITVLFWLLLAMIVIAGIIIYLTRKWTK
jgi:hypothetical protein